MINVSENLLKLRRECGMTQRELAEKLGVSFQTVSKWERGICYPDISVIPVLAEIFNTTTDIILGYSANELCRTAYSERYKDDSYHWGILPNTFCYTVLEKYPPTRHLKLLEIACGEGRDAVFFSRNGYDVTAYDIVNEGISKTKQLAAFCNTAVNAFTADMLMFEPKEQYDVVYCSRSLQYVPRGMREEFFERYKKRTNPGGIHAFMVMVDKPSVGIAPDEDINVTHFKSGEIFTYYHDWNFLVFEEKDIDCNSSGTPHRHCVNLMMAVKP